MARVGVREAQGDHGILGSDGHGLSLRSGEVIARDLGGSGVLPDGALRSGRQPMSGLDRGAVGASREGSGDLAFVRFAHVVEREGLRLQGRILQALGLLHHGEGAAVERVGVGRVDGDRRPIGHVEGDGTVLARLPVGGDRRGVLGVLGGGVLLGHRAGAGRNVGDGLRLAGRHRHGSLDRLGARGVDAGVGEVERLGRQAGAVAVNGLSDREAADQAGVGVRHRHRSLRPLGDRHLGGVDGGGQRIAVTLSGGLPFGDVA